MRAGRPTKRVAEQWGRGASKVLVDNSTLRVFAKRDPTARATNRLLRRLRLVPVVSMFTVGEVLHGLIDDPLHLEVRERCAFLLALEGVWLLPTEMECVLYEYSHQTALTEASKTAESVTKVVSLLKSAEGEMPSGVAAEGHKHYAGRGALYGASVQMLQAAGATTGLRSAKLADVMEAPVLADAAIQIVSKLATQAGEPIDEGLLLGAAMNAGRDNGRAPQLAGLSRTNAWFHWMVSQGRPVPEHFREDLIFLSSAPFADFLVSRDKAVVRVGPEIFPAVRFVNSDSFAAPPDAEKRSPHRVTP